MIQHILNIVDLIGIISGISEVFLGIGIIAIGNSFPGEIVSP